MSSASEKYQFKNIVLKYHNLPKFFSVLCALFFHVPLESDKEINSLHYKEGPCCGLSVLEQGVLEIL